MTYITRSALLLAPLLLLACGKKEPVAAPAPVVVAAPTQAAEPAAPVEETSEQRQLKDKQAKLAYATMEDKYMKDPRAQWATTASATSTYGDPEPAESHMAKQAIGPIDDTNWRNKNIELGFDSLELGYAKPVLATEVRLVIDDGDGVEAISKVELQAEDGKWNEIWSGISEVKEDDNGKRTWFVRSFPQTAYKVKAVRYTWANNLQHEYKNAEGAQLVGD